MNKVEMILGRIVMKTGENRWDALSITLVALLPVLYFLTYVFYPNAYYSLTPRNFLIIIFFGMFSTLGLALFFSYCDSCKEKLEKVGKNN